jgi:hypothetical protein
MPEKPACFSSRRPQNPTTTSRSCLPQSQRSCRLIKPDHGICARTHDRALTCDRRLPAPKVPVAAAASYIPLDPLKDHSEVSLCIILIFAAIDIICPRGLPCLRSSRHLNPVWVTGTGHGLGHDKGVLELLRFWSRPNLTQYMKVFTNRHFLHLSCITSFSFSALPLSSGSSLEALGLRRVSC